MSFSLSLHRIISLIPARLAASIFSLIPPTGSTFPLSVISPVIARFFFTLLWVSTEKREVSRAIPALGPSLGVAPSGIWIWILYWSKIRVSNPNCSACALIYSKAMVADSFITVPIFPVIESPPLPLEKADSIKRISPPTLVQANPVTTPATSLFSYLSRSVGIPNIFRISSKEIFGLYSSSMAIARAI